MPPKKQGVFFRRQGALFGQPPKTSQLQLIPEYSPIGHSICADGEVWIEETMTSSHAQGYFPTLVWRSGNRDRERAPLTAFP